jgi:hypothetical protein
MHVDNGPEILVADFLQRAVADIPGVVDEDVDPAVVLERRLDDRLAAFGRGNGLGAGHRLAAGGPDFPHHLLRGAGIEAIALDADAGIIDHNFGTLRGQEQGIGPTEPPAGAGYHGYAIVESEFGHGVFRSSVGELNTAFRHRGARSATRSVRRVRRAATE